MKKLSIAVAFMAGCTLSAAADIDAAFAGAKTEGYLRLGVESHDQQHRATDVALGGKLGFETAPSAGISAGVAFYTSQGLGKRDNLDIPFYDNDNHNYSILGETYIKAMFHHTTLTLGRQRLDTPFADSDDIGMVPNLFEAYTLTSTDIADTTFMVSHIVKWSGVDAPQRGQFTPLDPGHGIQALGAIYEGIDHTNLTAWYYHAENLADLLYLETEYTGAYKVGSYSFGVQYALQDFSGSDKASVWGMRGEFAWDTYGVTLNAAYNKTDSTGNVGADNFFGGGPFFTSSEHLTPAEAGVNGKAVMGGLSFDAAVAGMRGVTLSVSKLYVEGDKGTKADELDTILSYATGKNLSCNLIYSDMNDKKDSGASFTNLRFFANYRF
jgi:hypothetical protein